MKYQDFRDKKKHIATNWGDSCNSEHLWELAEEMLETIRCQEEALKTLNEGVAYQLKIKNT